MYKIITCNLSLWRFLKPLKMFLNLKKKSNYIPLKTLQKLALVMKKRKRKSIIITLKTLNELIPLYESIHSWHSFIKPVFWHSFEIPFPYSFSLVLLMLLPLTKILNIILSFNLKFTVSRPNSRLACHYFQPKIILFSF